MISKEKFIEACWPWDEPSDMVIDPDHPEWLSNGRFMAKVGDTSWVNRPVGREKDFTAVLATETGERITEDETAREGNEFKKTRCNGCDCGDCKGREYDARTNGATNVWRGASGVGITLSRDATRLLEGLEVFASRVDADKLDTSAVIGTLNGETVVIVMPRRG